MYRLKKFTRSHRHLSDNPEEAHKMGRHHTHCEVVARQGDVFSSHTLGFSMKNLMRNC